MVMVPARLLKFSWVKRLLLHTRRTPVLLTGAVLLGAAIGSFVIARTQQPLAVALAHRESIQVVGPLEVDFTQEIAPDYTATISPDVPGTWKTERTLLGISAARFVPKTRFEAGRTYHLHLEGLKRSVTRQPLPTIDQDFTAQIPPAVKAVQPAANATGVAVKPHLMITLKEPNKGVRELLPALTPAVPLKLVSSDDTVFIWEPMTPLTQGMAYTFTVDDGRVQTLEKRRLATVAFTVVTQPGIVSARTGGLLAPGQTVDIMFDQPMQTDAAPFEFEFKGKGVWADERTYKFTPEGLLPGKTYTYKIKAGAASKGGGLLEADHPYQIATNGAVTASVSPGGGVKLNTPMRVAFDQPVDHASAQGKFSTKPEVAGSFSWSGNTMIYTPTQTAFQTTYSFGVAAGVVPVWGLPSAKAMSGSYITENQTLKLAVPLYKQAYGRSCELASLRMLLAFRGIMVSDWDILMKIGYNPRPRDTASNSWENPNETFVGNVDTMSWSQGYGVHSGPIATAARTYGRNATAYNGVSAAFIAGQVHAGNPVEFWGHISPAKSDSWNTPSGVVTTTTSMHARVVYGVTGRPDAPIGFYINDPWTGSTFYWTAAELMSNMNAALPASNQVVVVF